MSNITSRRDCIKCIGAAIGSIGIAGQVSAGGGDDGPVPVPGGGLVGDEAINEYGVTDPEFGYSDGRGYMSSSTYLTGFWEAKYSEAIEYEFSTLMASEHDRKHLLMGRQDAPYVMGHGFKTNFPGCEVWIPKVNNKETLGTNHGGDPIGDENEDKLKSLGKFINAVTPTWGDYTSAYSLVTDLARSEYKSETYDFFWGAEFTPQQTGLFEQPEHWATIKVEPRGDTKYMSGSIRHKLWGNLLNNPDQKHDLTIKPGQIQSLKEIATKININKREVTTTNIENPEYYSLLPVLRNETEGI
jgi:hypothetical protein